jgi:hypothetical protein
MNIKTEVMRGPKGASRRGQSGEAAKINKIS